MLQLNQDAQTIVAAHPELALPLSAPPAVHYSRDDVVYRTAKQACLALGFIEIDAECLALAWLAMAQRTGRFDPQAWPDEPADFGLRPWPRDDAFAPCPKVLGLYAVLPSADWVGRMARAGVPTVQLRFKSDDAAAVRREVQAAVDAVRGTNALLFINDHWRDAIDAGAYGVHLGQDDGSVEEARERLGRDAQIGVTCHNSRHLAMEAGEAGADYVAFGAFFPTSTKETTHRPEVEILTIWQETVETPCVAIGGITAQNAGDLARAGADFVAVSSAVWGHPDGAAAAVREFDQVLAGAF